MFKIDEPKITELTDIKYKDIKQKEKLEEYSFKNENIELHTNVEINSCEFNGVIFDKVDIKFGNIEDVVFKNCDISNVRFIDTTIYRVKFENCKLFGTNFIDSSLNHITIKDSMCSLINITSTKLKNVELLNSNFKESTILECNIKNIILNSIDFTNSEILNTPLKDIDLSNTNLLNLNTDLYSIKGMIINQYQAMDLIQILGVKIKE